MTRSIWKGPYLEYKLLSDLQINYILKEKYTVENIKKNSFNSYIKNKVIFKRNITVLPYFINYSGLVLKGFTKGKATGGNPLFNLQGRKFSFEKSHLNLKVGHLVLTKLRAIFQSRKSKGKSKKTIKERYKRQYIRRVRRKGKSRDKLRKGRRRKKTKKIIKTKTRIGYKSRIK